MLGGVTMSRRKRLLSGDGAPFSGKELSCQVVVPERTAIEQRVGLLARLVVVVAACAIASVRSAQAEVPGPLVDSGWLSSNLDRTLILDVRVEETRFVAIGHVPGSVFVPWRDVRVDRKVDDVELAGMLPDRDVFENLMRRLGADNDNTIVIVSEGRNADEVTFATRLYWQLKYFGHDDVALLDGGMAAWRQAKLPVSHAPPVSPQAGGFRARSERKQLLATTSEVEEAITKDSAAIFDARDFAQYIGLYHDRRSVSEDGHIPKALFAPIDAFLAPGAVKTFLGRETLKAATLGLGADGPSIFFCNTGHLASGTWFVFHELAGNDDASLYDGSMNEWTRLGRATEKPVKK